MNKHRRGLVLILIPVGCLAVYQAIAATTIVSHSGPDLSVPAHSEPIRRRSSYQNHNRSQHAPKPSRLPETGTATTTSNNINAKIHHVEHVETTTNHSIYNRSLTLIASLRGEMGNNLGVLAMARLMKRLVERELPGVRVEILLQHQGAHKWKAGMKDLTQCFVNFRNISFKSGLWDPQFIPVYERQSKWLGAKNKKKLSNILKPNDPGLAFLKEILDKQAIGDPTVLPPEAPESKYSFPYLQATGMAVTNIMANEEDWDDIRSYFQFDTERCCAIKAAEPGETVFHFRNFVAELKYLVSGMVELSPNDTARILFDETMSHFTPNISNNHNNSGQKKVTIIGRFSKNAGNLYATALRERGWEPRVVMGQTGVQDFCLAMSATSLVGLAGSTYVSWAGILGNATLNRWYQVDVNAPSTKHVLTKKCTYQGREFWEEIHGRSEIMSRKVLTKHWES